MPDVENINLSKIIKRLELIKSLILLEEEDGIDAQIVSLKYHKKQEHDKTIYQNYPSNYANFFL
jgi:hypothetical protein